MAIMAKDWIRQKLIDNGNDKGTIYDMYEEFLSIYPDNYGDLESYKRTVRKAYNEISIEDVINLPDQEETLVRLAVQKQGVMDTNNVLRKVNRETFRIWNVLEGVYSEYVDLLGRIDLTKFKITPYSDAKAEKWGIIQITDTHFNEFIQADESLGNEYDFEIASRRLKKFIHKSLELMKFYEVGGVQLIITGDLINSNRRLSEKFASITSQTRASLLATYILQQAILDISKEFPLAVDYVVGNESRMGEDYMDSSDILASENWDYLILNNLRMLFANTGIKFNKPRNNVQTIFTLPTGFQGLLIHGHLLKGSAEKAVVQQLTQYLHKGIKIHGVFSGHFHNSAIGDVVSRSGSLCGGNAYSGNDLGFISRASHNAYIAYADHYDGFKFDLQDTTEDGYDLIEELAFYNVSSRRGNTRVTIENLV